MQLNSFPTATRASLRGQMPTEPAYSPVSHLIPRPPNTNHLPQTRRPDILTRRSGPQVLFSDAFLAPDLALVPVRKRARAVEA